MIEIPQHPDFSKNVGKGFGEHLYCIVCGKSVSNPKHHIRLFWGSTGVTQTEANDIIANEGEGGDLGCYPVGSDCLRKHPELKPYTDDAAKQLA
jgi:hypothetical protein